MEPLHRVYSLQLAKQRDSEIRAAGRSGLISEKPDKASPLPNLFKNDNMTPDALVKSQKRDLF